MKHQGNKTQKQRYYLAYGSNLCMAQMMEHRCPDSNPIGTTFIPDHELHFRGSKTGSYLTIDPKKNAQVPVGVWAVSANDEKHLDYYEGFPTFYYKEEIKGLPVILLGEKRKVERLDCFVYIMHRDRPFGIPSQSYVNTCLEGYDDFGLPETVLIRAVEDSYKLAAKGRGVKCG